ncbi:MAG TPA: hypothetical protein VF158_14495 [Longimicrobiales bacterium]
MSNERNRLTVNAPRTWEDALNAKIAAAAESVRFYAAHYGTTLEHELARFLEGSCFGPASVAKLRALLGLEVAR